MIFFKNSNRFKAIFLFFLVFLCLCLFGCNSGKQNSSDTVSLTVSFWGAPVEIEIIDNIINEWQDENPGVKVFLDHTPYSGYISKILTRIAGGTEPDIIACEVNLFPNFWGKDVFLNLNPYIEKDDDFNIEDFFPEVTKRFTIDSNIYGISRDTAPFACIYYNKELFDKAGLNYPSDDWTWDDLLDASEKLTKRDANGEVTQYGFYTWAWQNFVYSNGGSIVDDIDNPKEFTMDQPNAIEGLQFYVDLIRKYRVSPSPMNLINMGMGVEMMFKTKRLAMLGSGIWETPALKDIKDFDWDVVMFPKGPKGQRAFGTGGTAYCIMKSTKYPDLAWKIVKALTSQKAQEKLAASGLTQPARIEVTQGPYFAQSNEPPLNKGMLLDAVKYVVYEPFHPRWREIKDLYIREKMDLVYMGKLTVEKAMEELDSTINNILKDEN